MSRRERWLTTAAFIISVVPLLFMAYTLKLLPVDLPMVDIGIPNSEPEVVSKYNNLFMGLFCIVPLSIVLIARYLKSKLIYYKNFIAIMCVSIALSTAFTGIVLFGFFNQAERVEIKTLDIYSLVTIALSLAFAVFGTFIRYRRFGARIAINNKFTRSSQLVWRMVHSTVAPVQTIVFVTLAIVTSFLQGYGTVIIFGIVLIIFIIWVMFHSHYVKNMLDRRKNGAIIPDKSHKDN